MSKRSREIGEINAGSMADIAFLLLIFFLVTTTMDRDSGILRQLPPPLDETIKPPPVREQNVYEVLVNAQDMLLVEGDVMNIEDLRQQAKEFYNNPTNSEDLPEKTLITLAEARENVAAYKTMLATDRKNMGVRQELKKWERKLNACELLGGQYWELPSSAVISLQNDNGTSYEMYINVQNELSAAIRELRDDLSKRMWDVRYDELDAQKNTDKEKILAIRQVYPQRISEAEPKETGQ
jgi:biopolymer transport protein ExbD